MVGHYDNFIAVDRVILLQEGLHRIQNVLIIFVTGKDYSESVLYARLGILIAAVKQGHKCKDKHIAYSEETECK
jgi:hypothetical protein